MSIKRPKTQEELIALLKRADAAATAIRDNITDEENQKTQFQEVLTKQYQPLTEAIEKQTTKLKKYTNKQTTALKGILDANTQKLLDESADNQVEQLKSLKKVRKAVGAVVARLAAGQAASQADIARLSADIVQAIEDNPGATADEIADALAKNPALKLDPDTLAKAIRKQLSKEFDKLGDRIEGRDEDDEYQDAVEDLEDSSALISDADTAYLVRDIVLKALNRQQTNTMGPAVSNGTMSFQGDGWYIGPKTKKVEFDASRPQSIKVDNDVYPLSNEALALLVVDKHDIPNLEKYSTQALQTYYDIMKGVNTGKKTGRKFKDLKALLGQRTASGSGIKEDALALANQVSQYMNVGNWKLDLDKLREGIVSAVNSAGKQVMNVKPDLTFMKLLTERFNPKFAYTQKAVDTFRKLIRGSGAMLPPHSQKFKLVYPEASAMKTVAGPAIVYNDPNQLMERLKVLLGSVAAGNKRNPQLLNQATALLDELRGIGAISATQYSKIFKQYLAP